jgi:hypothetical protein
MGAGGSRAQEGLSQAPAPAPSAREAALARSGAKRPVAGRLGTPDAPPLRNNSFNNRLVGGWAPRMVDMTVPSLGGGMLWRRLSRVCMQTLTL